MTELFTKTFNLILYQPLFNTLVLLYQYLPGHDFGIAVIILTILIKILFYPLEILGIKSQITFSRLQPKIEEIKERYKKNLEKQNEEIIRLFRKEKINPLTGLLPLLIQIPILIALYRLFWLGFQPEQKIFLYRFVPQPELINPTFLNKINLAKPNIFLASLAGFTQFFQSKMLQPKTKKLKKENKASQFKEIIQKQTLYFFPLLTIFFLNTLPSIISLYWLVGLTFSIIQQYVIFKKI